MPSGKSDQVLFALAVAIKDEINQQIPLAANRYEAFDCPPKGETLDDLHEQSRLHTAMNIMLRIHFIAMDALSAIYHDFLTNHHLDTQSTLSEQQQEQVRSLLNRGLQTIYSKLERIWRMQPQFQVTPFEEAKLKLYATLQDTLEKLFNHGIDSLSIDEDSVIALYIAGLYENATGINARKHIDSLVHKVKSSKNNYLQRYKLENQLADIREDHKNNATYDAIINLTKSVASNSDLRLDPKIKTTLSKSQCLQRALIWKTHRYKTGYCDEHACLALLAVLEKCDLDAHHIEKVSAECTTEDGHTFIVINRSKTSVLSDLSTWGDEAILLDPWHRLVCYVKDLKNLDKDYIAFFIADSWSSLEFQAEDKRLLGNIKEMESVFSVTGNSDPVKREVRLMEEYGLRNVPDNNALLKHLESVVNRYKPNDFLYKITFYTTRHGNTVLKYIPGFREPAIAIHDKLISVLLDKTLSLSALEFAIVGILLQLKMCTSFISPFAIAPESQQKIDSLAIEKINSTASGIEYLRFAAEFEQKNKSNEMNTIDFYEKYFSGVCINALVHLSYAERIKVIQSKIAANFTRPYVKKIEYPSGEFYQALLSLSQMVAPTETDLLNINLSGDKIQTLTQLLEKIADLAIEIVPYESYNQPSIRLRQFAKLIRSLNIDYQNPKEVELVDQIVNKAHESNIPGFEYLYFALTDKWGVESRYGMRIHYVVDAPKSFDARNYYFIYKKNVGYQLVYVNEQGILNPIAIQEVAGLSEILATSRDSLIQGYWERQEIEFRLTHHYGLQALGFFKTIQRAITAFTQATSFEQAFQHATKLQALRSQYDMHLADMLCDDRRVYSEKADIKNKIQFPKRFYGSSLGKRIQWRGFDLSLVQDVDSAPYNPFVHWAHQDKSGIIAATLFRLGITNVDAILDAMTDKELQSIIKCESFVKYTFLGTLSTPCTSHFCPVNFVGFSAYLQERQSRKHQYDGSMFSQDLSFEEQFIRYFDLNLPVLQHPYLEANANHPALYYLLEQFMRVAQSGTDQEKSVVHSFFFGRQDKRDLPQLLDKNSLGISSPYAQFVLLQKLHGASHHLFDHYELDKLPQFYLHSNVTLEDFRIIFRLPNESNRETLFIQLLAASDRLKSYSTVIIDTYLHSITNPLDIFSPIVDNMIRSCVADDNYFPSLLCEHLNSASWATLESPRLDDVTLKCLLRIYSVCDYKTFFPSYEIKAKLGVIIFERIIKLTDCAEQTRFLELWLFPSKRKLALSDNAIKNTVVDKLIAVYLQQQGQDDGSDKYFNNIKPLLTKLLEQLSAPDLSPFMSKLLNAVSAQRKTSEFVGIAVAPQEYGLSAMDDLKKRALLAIIKFADYFSNNASNQKALLDFLINTLDQSSLNAMVDYIEKNIDLADLDRRLGWSVRDSKQSNKSPDKTRIKLSSQLMEMYYQFWNVGIKERAAIIEQLLIPASKTLSLELQNTAYAMGLSLVSQKLFPKAQDTRSDDHLAYIVLLSYLHTADPYMRSYLLAGMSVAAQSQQNQQLSVGKKLVMICEHMGPAYVKLAQAIHSHPKTSAQIRADLAHIKGKANPPTRWALWRQMAEVLPPDQLSKIKFVGCLLGSASYNLALAVTLQDDSQVVLLLLREGAEESAKNGFAHIQATIMHCQHPSVVKQRKMMSETIAEAARLSRNEMDKVASDKQSLLAERLYPKTLTVQGYQFNITTSRIIHSGTGFRFIERVYGEEFNAMPEDKFIKRAIAKAVLTMELHNIFRGGSFDSDRHGNQLRVQVNGGNIHLGLYDFGEMSLEVPTDRELNQFAEVINRLPLTLFSGHSFDDAISNRIDTAVKNNESTHYLMRLRKAFLAMHDFLNYLDKQDLLEILQVVSQKPDLHNQLSSALGRFVLITTGGGYLQRQYARFTQFFKASPMDLPDDEMYLIKPAGPSH